MIAHVRGKVTEKFNTSLIVDVNGLGYEVAVPLGDFDAANLDGDLKLYTYHHVREQSEELFGFSTLAAKKIFEMLIGVQGVGPKAALAILSLGEAEAVRNAIANDDVSFIQKATGVGKKTAERVVVDLRDKVGLPTRYGRVDSAVPEPSTSTIDDALEALMALGLSLADATKALEGVDIALPTSERVTLALRSRS